MANEEKIKIKTVGTGAENGVVSNRRLKLRASKQRLIMDFRNSSDPQLQ